MNKRGKAHSTKCNVYNLMLIVIMGMTLFLQSCYKKAEIDTSMKDSKKLRFVFIYSGNSDYFKHSLKEGIDKAAKNFNVWVNFIDFKLYEEEKHCEELDKAVAARVDGIITNIPDAEVIKKYVDLAFENSIPVITIENDLDYSRRISFIGTNSYEFGVNAANQIISASSGNISVAVFSPTSLSRQDLKNQGFINTVSDTHRIITELFAVEETSIIGYTNTAQSIFVNHPHINAFFCPDTESTLGVARAMIEFNKTDNILIGSGDSDEILKYIKSGLIYASLVEDPLSIGFLSVQNMHKYLKGESVSESINPDVIIITKDNIERVLAEREEKD